MRDWIDGGAPYKLKVGAPTREVLFVIHTRVVLYHTIPKTVCCEKEGDPMPG